MFTSLRNGLIERVRDKESSVRSLAVISLAKLVSSEDLHDLEVDEQSILEILLESLCYDSTESVFFNMVLDFIC